MGLFRVVILYSGRWFGLAARHWVDNHVSNLIRPAQCSGANVSVFVLVTKDQWCAGKEIKRVEEVQTEAQSMWGHAVPVHVTLTDDLVFPTEAHKSNFSKAMLKAGQAAAVAGGGRAGHASAFATGQLINFHRQFGNCVFADRQRQLHGHHDLIIKARIDVQYEHPVDLVPLWQRLSADSTLIFETETDQDASRFRPHWREWNIVTAERGMAALADAVGHIRPLYNDSRRCHGFCAEEQTVLQFESRGFHLTPLPWNMTLHRIYMKAPGESDEQLTARLSTVGSPSFGFDVWTACHVRGRAEDILAGPIPSETLA